MTDDELSRLAEEAILREAQRGAQRAELCGPSGWRKCKLPSTNKTFLHNTLLGALASNRAKEKQEQSRSERGRKRRLQEEKERNTYKRVYLHASTKDKSKQTEEQDEESPKVKKVKEESRPMFLWTESGLELSSTSRTDSKKRTDNKDKGKKVQPSVLSRKIQFLKSTTDGEETDDKR